MQKTVVLGSYVMICIINKEINFYIGEDLIMYFYVYIF